uniref:DNA-directed RNA polymerase III subunit RPC9 n=1 Tax=Timema tahoe TaxID=61484 RepID=A0A7R9NZE6_9NEOP|nr:unnamed protein product [Timema tahoe]
MTHLVGKTPISILRLEEPVNMFCSHRESSMLAVALQDYTVVVVDIDIRSVVRKFLGHSGQVTTMDFSPDSRWLITASMDCTIRTWDIPSAQLIDCFQMESPCVSLSMSPTGALLATAHVDCLGLFLWSNKTLYSHISLRPILQQEDIPTMGLPIPLGEEAELPRDSDQEDTDMQYQSPAQISQQLVTLSTLPSSRWHNLLHLDTIKMRNKPKDAPKAPKAAPFFLPTIPSLELRFELGQEDKPGGQIRDRSSVDIHSFTVFGKLLNQSRETGNFAPAIDKFLSLGPSALDFEVNSLSMESGGSLELMLQYLKLVKFMLDSNNNFELAQSYLGLFLKTHGDTIASQPVLREYLKTLESSQLAGWFSLQRKLSVPDGLKKPTGKTSISFPTRIACDNIIRKPGGALIHLSRPTAMATPFNFALADYRRINANAATLSNYEVLTLLQELRGSQKRTNNQSQLATITYETIKYLQDTPCNLQTPEMIHKFLKALKPYKLTKAEKLLLLNNPPKTPLEIQLIVEESEERLSDEQVEELLQLVQSCELIPNEAEPE